MHLTVSVPEFTYLLIMLINAFEDYSFVNISSSTTLVFHPISLKISLFVSKGFLYRYTSILR